MDHLSHPSEGLILRLRMVIHGAVRVLAVMMTAVIVWGVLDVLLVLYKKLSEPPYMLLTIKDMLATFGAFMAVLIAIEIFVNIIIYLRDDVIHEQLVVATALMAIARKVIIMDFDKLTPAYILAIAAVVFAMSFSYWVVVVRSRLHGKSHLGASPILPPAQIRLPPIEKTSEPGPPQTRESETAAPSEVPGSDP